MHIPADLRAAVRVGLHGQRRCIDTGSVNGEHFAVMAGAGFDASMISAASRALKDRLGRAAYLYTAVRNLSAPRACASIEVDGEGFFEGPVSCVLAGNVGKITGGVEAFRHALPDDGLLELGVVTARNPAQWARAFGQVALGRPERSAFVHLTRGAKIKVKFDRKLPYELDGGARSAVRKLRIKVHRRSVSICVPAQAASSPSPP